MMKYKVTTERATIKDWIERHEGMPAVIGEGKERMVRIDFAGKEDEHNLSKARKSKEVSWDEFFDVFEKSELAFIYYPNQDIDDPTLAYRFVKRENVDELETDGTSENNFSNPEAIETLPSHLVQTRVDSETASEEEVGGDMPDPSSDDDTTRNARDFNLVLEDDPQAQEKN